MVLYMYENDRRSCMTPRAPLQQIEVVQLVVVLCDRTLDVALVQPGDEVLEVPRDEEGGVCDDVCADADLALLDVCHGLSRSSAERMRIGQQMQLRTAEASEKLRRPGRTTRQRGRQVPPMVST